MNISGYFNMTNVFIVIKNHFKDLSKEQWKPTEFNERPCFLTGSSNLSQEGKIWLAFLLQNFYFSVCHKGEYSSTQSKWNNVKIDLNGSVLKY